MVHQLNTLFQEVHRLVDMLKSIGYDNVKIYHVAH